MNRRRVLSSVHRSMARKQGVNAAAWFYGQSFTSASRSDMPLTQLSVAQLDQAGAALLPQAETEPCAYGCGHPASRTHAPYCSAICAVNAERS